ncbi:MAG: DUF4124 domain-containing protein [Lysobacteraceae bacterium]
MPGVRLAAATCVLVLVVALPSTAPAAAPAGGMVIYRCVDPASGAVTLQNDVPCPKGQQQTVRNVAPLPAFRPPPAPPPAPAAADARPAAPAPVVAADPPPPPVRTPPPPLFQCRTWDDRDYLGDVAEPPGSCVALETVGIDGSTALAAGQACEMRRDTCTAVPAEQLCVAWKKRVDEAEFRWKIAGGRDGEQKAEFDRVARTYRASTCGG